jgi:predicted GIY-YIG superfamily endonuclease
MKYVYILQCESDSTRYYTGLTDNLQARLKAHNAGQVFHTSKFKPWRLNTYIAFRDEERAIQFEKYLKTHSGRVFARKHL